MERFVALTILIVLLPPCRTASDCSPQCNVHANQSQWPVSDESTTDVSEIVYLRCFTACSDEVLGSLRGSSSEVGVREAEIADCVDGCLRQHINSSLTEDKCTGQCGASAWCSTGCTVFQKIIKDHQPVVGGEPLDTPHCPAFDGVAPMAIGERAYISTTRGTCLLYACQASIQLGAVALPQEVNCSILAFKNCSLDLQLDQIRLAKCCGFCPVPPSQLSTVQLTVADNTTTKYNVTLPSLEGEEQRRESVAFLLRLEEIDRNLTAEFALTKSRSSLSLLPFVCTKMSISFTVVNKFGASNFSPSVEFCVDPPTALPTPGPVRNLTVTFEEDFREKFEGHAYLHVTWGIPEDRNGLEYYNVEWDSLPDVGDKEARKFCAKEVGLPVTYYLDTTSTNLTISAKDGNATTPPQYGCVYSVTVVSQPGGTSVSTQFKVQYSGSSPALNLTCEAQFDPYNASYNLIGRWEIANDPLVLDSLERFTAEAHRETRQRIPIGGVWKMEVTPQVNETKYKVVFQSISILREKEGYYRMTVLPRTDKLWRKPLIPSDDWCTLNALPVPPPAMASGILANNLTIHYLRVEGGTRRDAQFLLLYVTWEPPTFPNGELEQYQLRIGREEIVEETSNSGAFKITEINPNRRKEFVNASFPFSFGPNTTAEILYLQMRFENEFDFSPWSIAVQLDTSEANATFSVIELEKSTGGDDDLPVYVYILFGVAGLVLLAALLVPVIVWCYRSCFHFCIKYESDEKIPCRPPVARPLTLSYLAPCVTDKWELMKSDIQVFDLEPLGRGCFGEVYRGHLASRKLSSAGVRGKRAKYSLAHTVAVKRLKDNATGTEKANFLKEIETMKKVSDTNNELSRFVVTMVGCVTTEEPLLLVLEYVRHGDLLTYLRSMKKQATAVYYEPASESAVPYLEPNGVYSQLAPREDGMYSDLGVLEERHLLEFARQIAAGMEFLSGLDVVHRDLACRNILVGEKKALKISDFGMSRLVPAEEVYVHTSQGLLPLRWMAIESIIVREFTTASDVWAYGIILWEICTMGAFPYPYITNQDLPGMLKQGYRMDKPQNCSDEVYEVMLQCWCEDQMDRPTFSNLHKTFDQFLSNHTQDRYPYIELQVYSYDHLEPHPQEGAVLDSTTDDHTGDTFHSQSCEATCGCSQGAIHQLQVPDGQLLWRGSHPDIRGSCALRETEFAERLSLGRGDTDNPERRYVESPVNLSLTSTLSIQGALIAHLERKLSSLGTDSNVVGEARLTSSYGRPRTIHTDQPGEHVFQLSAPPPSSVNSHQHLRVHSVCTSELERYQVDRVWGREEGGRYNVAGEEEEEEMKGGQKVVFRETDV